MSRFKMSGVVLVALLMPAMAATAKTAVPVRHHQHHARVIGPGVGVGPGWDLYGPTGGGYGENYGYYGGGAIYNRNSGGVNSMSNDFGTSGVLGHTNGMPATGP